jgi:predicted Zn-dependent protease
MRWERLGETCIAAGFIPEGARALRAAAKLDPKSEVPWRALAQLYHTAGYLDRELDALEQLAALATRDPMVYLRLAEEYTNLYWYDRVPALLKQAEGVAPNLAAPRLELARYNFRMRSTQAAIQDLQTLNKQFPDDGEVAHQLALDLLTVGRPADADAVLRAALKRHPDDRKLVIALAYNCVNRVDGDYSSDAIAVLQPIVKASPADPEPWCWLGRAYERARRPADAAAAYQQAYLDEPSFENVAFALGRLYAMQGKKAESRRLMEYYAKIDKNARAFSTTLAEIAQKPNDPAIHVAAANWYTRLGVHPKAVLELKRAIQLGARGPETNSLLRQALLAAGRRTEAARLQG